MNATFETIRKDLKKYNAEDNDAPPKLVVAGSNDFLDVEHKKIRNSQFIIAVKEFFNPDKPLVETMLSELEIRSGRRPLAFFYNSKEAIETVINDFQDYYNKPLGDDVFQKVGSSADDGELQYYLVIVVAETYYYES